MEVCSKINEGFKQDCEKVISGVSKDIKDILRYASKRNLQIAFDQIFNWVKSDIENFDYKRDIPKIIMVIAEERLEPIKKLEILWKLLPKSIKIDKRNMSIRVWKLELSIEEFWNALEYYYEIKEAKESLSNLSSFFKA